MAYPGKIISNPIIGQQIRFIRTSKDTDGALLEMESIYHNRSREPVPHYHPKQAEDFVVLEGELTVKINGDEKKLQKGDHLHIPSGTVHSMWNAGEWKTVVNWRVKPAFETEYFLETANGLATDGKANAEGMPSLLQIVMLTTRFSREFRIAKPPFIVQQLVFSILRPFAFLAGYRGWYDRYID